MISELSTGDKLSIKGKLFELTKKLTMIEHEKEFQQRFPFQPETTKYSLPERANNCFLGNIEKAEIIRKQKLEMLKANMVGEEEDNCTFKPKINRIKRTDNDDRPVHLRLTEKGKEYKQNHKQRVANTKMFDENGAKMFQPIVKHGSGPVLPSSNISADEFLYRDARDREERMRQRSVSAKEEVAQYANSRKINTKSEILIRRKAEREVRALFDFLDEEVSGELGYGDIQRGAELLVKKGFLTNDLMYKTVEQVWTALDEHKRGCVDFADFLRICIPFTIRTAGTARWVDEAAIDLAKITRTNASVIGGESDPNISENNLALKVYVKNMLSVLRQRQGATSGASNKHKAVDSNFRPQINERSRNLAQKKEMKDKQSIAELLDKDKLAGGQRESAVHSRKDLPRLPRATTSPSSSPHHSPSGTQRRSHRHSTVSTSPSVSQTSSPPKHQEGEIEDDIDLSDDEETSSVDVDLRFDERGGIHLNDNYDDYCYDSGEGGDGQINQDDGDRFNGAVYANKVVFGQDRNKKETLHQIIGENNNRHSDRNVAFSKLPPKISSDRRVSTEAWSAGPNQPMAGHSRSITAKNGDKRVAKLSENISSEGVGNLPQQQSTSVTQPNNHDEDEGSVSSSTTASTAIATTHDLLFARRLLTEQKLEKKKFEMEELRNIDCTFRPSIYPAPKKKSEKKSEKANDEASNNQKPSQKAHERLYALKDKPPVSKNKFQPKYVTEMQGCTFAPKLEKKINSSAVTTEQTSKDFNKTVKRLREAREARLKREEEIANFGVFDEEKYNKSREALAKGVAPFHFQLEERRQQAKAQQIKKTPRLYVDVKLPMKTAHIAVCDGDDPGELAENFCRIYSLDTNALGILTEVVRKCMEDNGIPFAEVTTRASSPQETTRSRRSSDRSGNAYAEGTEEHLDGDRATFYGSDDLDDDSYTGSDYSDQDSVVDVVIESSRDVRGNRS